MALLLQGCLVGLTIDYQYPRILLKEYIVFQVPRNLNYLYSFGGILMICLMTLIVTGLILGMHYKPDVASAFDSVERIMRDVNHG